MKDLIAAIKEVEAEWRKAVGEKKKELWEICKKLYKLKDKS